MFSLYGKSGRNPRYLLKIRECKESNTPLQATGYQTCSAAEQRGIWPSRQSPNVCKQPLGSLLAGIKREHVFSHGIAKSIVIPWNNTHIAHPNMVGIIKERNVHFRLPVSLRIVRQVVAHGQWTNVKSITLTAVVHVHPFCTRSCFKILISLISAKLPCERYAIIIIGTTISFAGSPNKNASKMTPSNPIAFAGISNSPDK